MPFRLLVGPGSDYSGVKQGAAGSPKWEMPDKMSLALHREFPLKGEDKCLAGLLQS